MISNMENEPSILYPPILGILDSHLILGSMTKLLMSVFDLEFDMVPPVISTPPPK